MKDSLDHLKPCRRVLLGTNVSVFGYLCVETGAFFLDNTSFIKSPVKNEVGSFTGYHGVVEPVVLENPVSGVLSKVVHVEVESKPEVKFIQGKWVVCLDHSFYGNGKEEKLTYDDALNTAFDLLTAKYYPFA